MTKTGAKLFRMFVLLCVVLSSVPTALPQTTTTGAVEGSVLLLGAPDKGIEATIVVTNLESGLERSSATKSGNYSFLTLPPGYYRITVTAPGYENYTIPSFAVRLKTNLVIPPITLQTATVAAVSPPSTPVTPQKRASSPADSGAEQLTNTINASRGQSFDRRLVETLPLPGVRTFDDLAFLSPGFFPPPQAIGNSVGPGVGAGVGTSGQFSVNGLRSRSNNFTIDGSDNNDDDIGVRRQGFTSLVPQSIESLQEFRVISLLPEPQFGRTSGGQVNAVSRSGGSEYHGMLYGFFTNRSLKARDVFDLTGGPSNFPIIRASDGAPVLVNGAPLAPANPVEGENPFTRGQYGVVFGGTVVKDKMNFFVSFERQDLKASRESHFAVPTVAQRGLTVLVNGIPTPAGDRGIFEGGFFGGPTSQLGDAFFSLFPFPNNPRGPYAANTYTEVLGADAKGTVLSGKLDRQNIKAFGKQHSLTGRYNFTDDDTVLPVTGGAIFSSLEALVRTQNLSLFFDSVIGPGLANQFRTSYGRTSLGFEEVRDPFLLPAGRNLTDPRERRFLLNATLLRNVSRVGLRPGYVTLEPDSGGGAGFPNKTTEDVIKGPLGQLVVSGYSPVGVNVFNFPQGRVNNAFQYADTLIYTRVNQKFTAGFDIRRVQLNSFLDRGFRPLAVFSGGLNGTNPNSGIPLTELAGTVELQGTDFVAVGAPTGFSQTLALIPDSTIGLRSWQNDFFLADQIRVRPGLTITLGARYQLNTVPTEINNRIERTFSDQQVSDPAVEGLSKFLAGRKKIYNRDANNIGPHIAVAWDPFGKGRTSIRAGYGIYYDQIPGAVVSQSRSVFPSFLTFNLAGISGLNIQNPGLDFLNPSLVAVPKTLNTVPVGSTAAGLISSLNNGSLNPGPTAGDPNGFAFPDFVLPAADLVTPYAQHWGLTVEQEFKQDFLLSLAYVGTRGVHLLRFATPNLGPNTSPVVKQAPAKIGEPIFIGSRGNLARPFPKLGSFTSIESDADSTYHSLQVQMIKRLSRGLQLTTSYAWSHAIDEVSELFDLAGARALPQNSFDRASERGDANFDVRHRFVYSIIWDLPGFRNNLLLGGWQVASIGTFQTGQPYSVFVFFDANLDGNLTDRIAPDGTLAGRAGRNLFRAPSIATIDMALNKVFKFSERQNLQFRTEFFNLFNRSNFGVPVNELFFGGLGNRPLKEQVFADTRVPARTIQFALKYRF